MTDRQTTSTAAAAPALSPATAAAAGSPAAGVAPPSDRVRLRRMRERGSHERAVIDAIFDEGLIAHLGIVDEDGQPFVVPTLHARSGDVVYLHGSAAGRAMKALAKGAPACVTVSLLDGLVLARSAMHHSANYRSVMLLGTARLIEEPARKRAALEAVVEHVVPGRWAEVRAPTDNELKATSVLEMAIDEASAKIRTGGPVDDEEDYALDTWAGVLPMRTVAGAPQRDERLPAHIGVPGYVSGYARPHAVQLHPQA
jgi:nitroimidazol reductase NimA-like FMN-containing flavoprotein (pyridoxamine 5'-phosphate oxidase superfamily)